MKKSLSTKPNSVLLRWSRGKIIAIASLATIFFAWSLIAFSFENGKRIQNENREYLVNNATHMADDIDDDIAAGYANIKILSRLVSNSLTEPSFDIRSIQELINNSVFDFMEFADKDGMDHNITGGVSDARDRQYYLDAKAGNVGMELIYYSRATHETLLMFYSPIYYEKEFIGSLVGVYQASNRITKLLQSNCFGEAATSYLATEEGVIIASDQGFDPKNSMYVNDLAKDNTKLRIQLQNARDTKEPLSFKFEENTTGGYMCTLPSTGWILVQIFPQQASENLISAANKLAFNLIAILLVLYIIVVAVLIQFYHHQQDLVEEANQAKTSFLFNMSHDIRTPMNAVIGFTNMGLKHIDDKEKVKDCLIKTQQSGNLLLSLINNILDVSRIESGHAQTEELESDMYSCFSNIESTLCELAGTKSIALNFDFGEIQDRFVFVDVNRCTRIFTNLITNSIKYTNEGGHIHVRCEQVSSAEDGKALYQFTFTDDGIGMTDEFQKHMFEPFSREKTSTLSGIQGTGLGLSVCKTFVDYLNGSIECQSEPGLGTTFIVTLPTGIVLAEESRTVINDIQASYGTTNITPMYGETGSSVPLTITKGAPVSFSSGMSEWEQKSGFNWVSYPASKRYVAGVYRYKAYFYIEGTDNDSYVLGNELTITVNDVPWTIEGAPVVEANQSYVYAYSPEFTLYEMQNVQIDENGIMTWDPVAGASEYNIMGAFSGATAYTNSYDLKELLVKYDSATYTISIYPYDENGKQMNQYGWRGDYNYVSTVERLDAPANIHLEGNTLLWDAVENTGYYNIYVSKNDDDIVSVNYSFSTSYTLDDLENGSFYVFYVEAMGITNRNSLYGSSDCILYDTRTPITQVIGTSSTGSIIPVYGQEANSPTITLIDSPCTISSSLLEWYIYSRFSDTWGQLNGGDPFGLTSYHLKKQICITGENAEKYCFPKDYSIIIDGIEWTRFSGVPVNGENACYDYIVSPDFTIFSEPQLSSVANTASGVQITWDPVEKAPNYEVLRKTAATDWEAVGTTTSTSFVDKTAISGTQYFYTAQALDAYGTNGKFNGDGLSISYIAAPAISSITNIVGGVQLKWGQVNGASQYAVFRKNDSGGWTKLANTTSTSYTDKNVTSGKKYTYTVRCLDESDVYISSFNATGKTITYVAAPVISGISSVVNGVQIKWGKVTGASQYAIFRKNDSGGWTKLASTTSLSYIDQKAPSGKKCTYTVRCLNGSGAYISSYDTTGKTIAYVAAPVISGVSNVVGGVQIKWGKVAGAAKYAVFRKNDSGGWTKLATTSSTSYTDKKVSSGKKYTYTIRCLNASGGYASSYNTTGKAITYVAAPTLSSVAKVSGGVQVKWGKVTGASKYAVFRKTGTGGWSKIATTSSTSYTDKKVSKGKKYTYTVRCINSSGAYISSYNATGKAITY